MKTCNQSRNCRKVQKYFWFTSFAADWSKKHHLSDPLTDVLCVSFRGQWLILIVHNTNRPLLLERNNLKRFSTVFDCHSRKNDFYLFSFAFTGIWVPEEFHSHTRHVVTLVRLRSKSNKVRVNWEQQFVSNSQVSHRTSHKKLKRNPEKGGLYFFLFLGGGGGGGKDSF